MAKRFVKWEEVFSTNPRGRREVRYYLKRRDGTSVLAVVGKDKNSGRNLTVPSSSSFRYRYAIRDSLLFSLTDLPFEVSIKLRSRREVIDWLSSLVSDDTFFRPPPPPPPPPMDGFLGAGDTLRLNSEKVEDVHLHKMSRPTTEFLWAGSFWTCRKKRKHYEAYTCGGVRISVHDFVYVLAEEDKRLVAYLDDLYEDSRGNKTAVVRWFHKVDEVGLDLPHSYNDNEIFFSLCLQDLSIKCIDGLATVLSPQHYENFLKMDVDTKFNPFVCRNQFDNEVVNPFDITQVKGYWGQNIHKFMSDDAGIRPRKKLRRLADAGDRSDLSGSRDGIFSSEKRNLADGCVREHVSTRKHEYKIGSLIEVLSQDSGIRGIWFKAVVIKKHKDKMKVRYEDIKDAEDESINLEEWIFSSRVAAPDQLGIRHHGRPTVRPSRLANTSDVPLVDVGSVVDAWLHDGWWEGIVIHKESDDKIHVYFPGEKQTSIFGCKDLRYSEEWLGDRWKQMKSRPDLLGSISSETNPQTTKSHDNLSTLTGTLHDKDPENTVEFEAGIRHESREDLLTHLNWNWSTKKRHGRKSFHSNNLVAITTRKRDRDRILLTSSVEMDRDNCKFVRGSSLFRPLVASRLVMSR